MAATSRTNYLWVWLLAAEWCLRATVAWRRCAYNKRFSFMVRFPWAQSPADSNACHATHIVSGNFLQFAIENNTFTGWWYTYPSEKWWSSSLGMTTFPTEWKVKKFMFQTTNQINMGLWPIFPFYGGFLAMFTLDLPYFGTMFLPNSHTSPPDSCYLDDPPWYWYYVGRIARLQPLATKYLGIFCAD